MELGLIGVAIAIPCLLLALADRKKIIAKKREEFAEETRNLILTQAQKQDTELESCPFCGGTNVYTKQDGDGFWHVICDERGCRVNVSNDKYPYATETEAKDAWNRRVKE